MGVAITIHRVDVDILGCANKLCAQHKPLVHTDVLFVRRIHARPAQAACGFVAMHPMHIYLANLAPATYNHRLIQDQVQLWLTFLDLFSFLHVDNLGFLGFTRSLLREIGAVPPPAQCHLILWLQCDSRTMPSPRSRPLGYLAAQGTRRGSLESTASRRTSEGHSPSKHEQLDEEEIEMMMEMESLNGDKFIKSPPRPDAEEFPILASQNR